MDFNESVKKAKHFLQELETPFVGRHEEALVIVLALLSGEHAVLVGEPGTAKSALVRRAAALLKARFFKYLLTRYTEPSELFGPLDIRALKAGTYARVTKGKLSEAEIAFLDEIFNASSAVLNSLLSILMERVVYDGYTEIRAPLWSLFGSSNRVPDEPELEALYDRFLLRAYVKPLDQDYWDSLLTAAWKLEVGEVGEATPVLTMKELEELHKEVLRVNVNAVKSQLIKLLLTLEGKGLHVSDRRKGKILKVIAAHALLNGRKVATEDDLIVLKYTVPKALEDFEKINVILMEELKTRERVIRELNELKASVKLAATKIQNTAPYDPRLTEYYRSLNAAKNKISNLVKDFDNDEEIRRLADDLMSDIEDLIHVITARLNV
ncbi:MAG: MoxR family ATPase [Acidilobaceae archaeon]|nr:MoxR family ATPase [Acidilobaceae archaeon]MCX8165390.1 MoxR family ATPase [Acidilobaceae archaeon]MDW7973817.1 AAA family ATPase [Sulfolobales archaeon]